MSNSGVLADPLGKVGDLGNQVSKGIGDEAAKIEKITRVQVGIESQQENDNKNASNVQNQVPSMPSSKDTLEIIKKMYEASKTKGSVPSDKIISGVIQENPKKTPEEIQKMAATRQQLWQQQHKDTYFDPTFNPQGKPQEERPAEQIEKEKKEKKQMEELKLQKEEKKKEELSPSVKEGTHEKIPGVSG